MSQESEILKEFCVKLKNLYGNQLKSLILFGSKARKESNKDSDIDLAVVLKGIISQGKEIDRMIDIITDYNLNYNVLFSVYPVSEENFHNLKSPLLLNIRKEGVKII